ncbi:MAG: hypothetical protein HFI45_00640 [Lachnospiraceae bacterium]|nr:hypothetical protein [Lachnospiraceae bacterium]
MKEIWSRLKADRDYRIRFIVAILCMILILVIVLPIIVASSMSFYRGDDFADMGTIWDSRRNIAELFLDSLRYTKKIFFSWQGNYFSMFMQMFLSPLLGKGLPQLRVIMVINSVLFVIGLSSFIWGIFKHEIDSGWCRLVLIFCCFLGILGFEVWYQIFYWYTGAIVYTFPLSLAMIALAMILLSDKKFYSVLAGVLLFCAAGGSLAIAAIACYWLLLVIVSRILKKNIRKKDYILLFIAIAGSLVNSLAPGNFARHSVIDDSGLHLFRAVIFSFSETVITGEWLFLETPFIIIAIIAFFVGICVGKRKIIDASYLWVMIVLNAFTPIVTYFPVCLGYSSGGGPNRCRFILTLAFVISAVVILVFLGETLSQRIQVSCMREVIVMAVLLLIIMPIKREGWKITSLVPYRTMMELTEGNIPNYYREANKIYDAMRDDENEDVFIFTMPNSIDEFLAMDIKEDPNYLINTECAYYFGKRSVQYVSEPVYVSNDNKTYVRIAPSYFEHDLQFVSIFNNSASQGTEEIQVLEPFDNNLVVEMSSKDTGSVSIYVFADADGREILEEMEISY